jgi:uncharacterized membrane protein HdeD (DUF308 family)
MPIILARNWWILAVRGLAAIAFGILTVISPGSSLLALVILFGAYAIVDGAFNLVMGLSGARGRRWTIMVVQGLLGIAAGVLTFIWPAITTLVLLSLIGVWAVVSGVLQIVAAVRLRQQIQGEWLLGLAGALSIVFGVLLLLFPAAGALTVVLWIGAWALVFGVLTLVLAFRLRSWARTVSAEIPRAAGVGSALPLLLLAPVIAMLGSGCATVSVKTDSDPSVDFSRYRTFQVLDGKIIVDGREDATNTLVKDRIQNAIVAQLSGKGYQPVDSGGDLLVGYVAGARTVTEIEGTGPYGPGFGPYWGFGGWWGPAYTDWWTRTYTKGTLVIDLIDSQSKKLVWRAYAEADLKSPDADDTIQKAVKKAFAKFPPGRGGGQYRREAARGVERDRTVL